MYPKLSVIALGLMTAFSAHAEVVAWQTSKADDWHKPVLTDNTSALVFIRANQSMSHDSGTNIAINNRYLTSLNDGHYSTDVVCAGSVRISVTSTKTLTNDLTTNSINVALIPGQVQFVYVEVDAQYRPSLRAISEQDAMPLIAKANRQIHQISRTTANDCSTSWTPPTQVATQPPAYVVPPVVSVGSQQTAPNIRLNVHFDYDKATVKAGYQAEIKRVANFLSEHPDVSASVEGHTDAHGDESYNQALSQRRAEVVRQALIKTHEINPNRLVAKGYGESAPIADNKTAEGRAQNRRVVISVPANH